LYSHNIDDKRVLMSQDGYCVKLHLFVIWHNIRLDSLGPFYHQYCDYILLSPKDLYGFSP